MARDPLKTAGMPRVWNIAIELNSPDVVIVGWDADLNVVEKGTHHIRGYLNLDVEDLLRQLSFKDGKGHRRWANGAVTLSGYLDPDTANGSAPASETQTTGELT